MAITYDTSAIDAANAATGNVSLTVADNSNRVLVFIAFGASGITGVTFDGSSFTAMDSKSGNGYHASMWFLGNPSVGTYDVGWTSGSVNTKIFACVSLYGADTGMWGATATEQEIATSTDLDIVLRAVNSWTVELQGGSTNVTHTQDSGQTERQDANPSYTLALATKAHTNAGSTNLGYTNSGNTENIHIIGEIVEPGALGGGNFIPFL